MILVILVIVGSISYVDRRVDEEAGEVPVAFVVRVLRGEVVSEKEVMDFVAGEVRWESWEVGWWELGGLGSGNNARIAENAVA